MKIKCGENECLSPFARAGFRKKSLKDSIFRETENRRRQAKSL